jgi:hypothetical protein
MHLRQPVMQAHRHLVYRKRTGRQLRTRICERLMELDWNVAPVDIPDGLVGASVRTRPAPDRAEHPAMEFDLLISAR